MAIRATLTISMAAAIICSSVLFCCRNILGYAFSNEKEVVDYLRDMTPFLCVLIVSDCIQAVLSGMLYFLPLIVLPYDTLWKLST